MPFVTNEISELVKEIAEILESKNQTIAVSEAACGGLLSSYLVSIAGASKFYQGGTLVYSLKSKLKLSGWSEKEILSYTGPSESSVLKQARNLKIELGSTYVLCESGFAGPTVEVNGATTSPTLKHQNIQSDVTIDDTGKVGTVYLGISGPNGEKSIVKHTNLKDRKENMEAFAKLGLEFLLKELNAQSKNN